MPAGPQCRSSRAPIFGGEAMVVSRHAAATLAMRSAVRSGQGADRGGTACLLLADQQGNAVSLVQSVFNVFGSMVLDPATGILFNNRMQGFTHRPGKPKIIHLVAGSAIWHRFEKDLRTGQLLLRHELRG